jgi:nitric oxide reductase NorD protein
MNEQITQTVLDNIGLRKNPVVNVVIDVEGIEPCVRCAFDDASNFLKYFIRGLAGRELHIVSGNRTFTDTESLYLPSICEVFPFVNANFILYKLTAAHLWAQTSYGTWRYEIVEKLMGDFATDDVMPLFNRLECIRLDACMARDFPGLYREFEALGYKNDETHSRWIQWTECAGALIEPNATAEDSLCLIGQVKKLPLPPLKNYQGEMLINKVHEVMITRIEHEKSQLKRLIQATDLNQINAVKNNFHDESMKQLVGLKNCDADDQNIKANIQLSIGAGINGLSTFSQELITSTLQDFEGIPMECTQLLDLGEYNKELPSKVPISKGTQQSDTNLPGIFRYDEWDYRKQQFRNNFCTLRELPSNLGDESFVDETVKKNRHLLNAIKKTFESILIESRLQRRQSDGDDLDLDAIVKAYTDAANGQEMSEHLYTRYRNQNRNIAVMFMVDMSGSTLGWVNKAERESLVLLCEALEMVGDRYAIYGFSGRSNEGCEIYCIKTFDQPYDLHVRQRISGIGPKTFTRMGTAIRHLGQKLQLTSAHTKLLITLSDGRPEDCDEYNGQYGIEDTRHALLEIKKNEIQSFCITIDKQAQEYLPYMYGAANYTVIDEVDKLSQKVTDIYRRLTT